MDTNKIFELGLRALACPTCQSSAGLELQDDQLHCPDCGASQQIVDGVLDLMPPVYTGYQGDSLEAAALRDAHNRQALLDDTFRFRGAVDRILNPQDADSRQNPIVLDAGCGTGHLTRIIAEAHPGAILIAVDVSLPMCRLAAVNCSGLPVLVVRAPTTHLPFRNAVFDLVVNRLAHLDPVESCRLLRPGGYAVAARHVEAQWEEIRQIFPEDRLIIFPHDLDPTEAFFEAGFSEAESHAWRFTKTHAMEEIITVLSYAPVVYDFDCAGDQEFLRRLEENYGTGDGIRLTEGEAVVIGRKGS